MGNVRRQLGEILVAHRILTKQQLGLALQEQRADPKPIGQILMAKGWLTKRQLMQVLAAQRGIRAWDFETDRPDPEALGMIESRLCFKHQILAVRRQSDLLYVAMVDPSDVDVIELVRNLTGCRIEPVLVDAVELRTAQREAAIAQRLGMQVNTRSFRDEAKNVVAALNLESSTQGRTELTEEQTKPVESLVNALLSDAISKRATDLHIEPGEKGLVVRIRLDGILHPLAELPLEIGSMLTARIKIMAGLDIVEYRLPQDGQMNVRLGARDVDVRASTIPSKYGQRIVLRLLDQQIGLRSLPELGMSPRHMEVFERLIRRPHGLLLVSGPTGSGKTTTLYAALQTLTDGTKNVMTCEDPIEYCLAGVNQSQTNEKSGLTFARLLRAQLRQDPDVILVGEIRDQETAETAVRAAMTGHLVLATVHANDAPSATARLLDLGVDPSLLSSCLVGSLAQRLVRSLCSGCKAESEDGWTANGCEQCSGATYSGRIAIHEVLEIDSEVRKLISQAAPVVDVLEAAESAGYRPMLDDALNKVSAGFTTVEEVKRHVWFDSESKPGLRIAA